MFKGRFVSPIALFTMPKQVRSVESIDMENGPRVAEILWWKPVHPSCVSLGWLCLGTEWTHLMRRAILQWQWTVSISFSLPFEEMTLWYLMSCVRHIRLILSFLAVFFHELCRPLCATYKQQEPSAKMPLSLAQFVSFLLAYTIEKQYWISYKR